MDLAYRGSRVDYSNKCSGPTYCHSRQTVFYLRLTDSDPESSDIFESNQFDNQLQAVDCTRYNSLQFAILTHEIGLFGCLYLS